MNTAWMLWLRVAFVVGVGLLRQPTEGQTLQFIPPTGGTVVPRCDDCSSDPIHLPSDRLFPFGSYYHDVVHVGTNGVISFGREFNFENVTLFPSTSAGIYFSYVVAPFWSDIDTRLAGKVTYSVHDSSSTVLESVNNYIRSQLQDDSNFSGIWALVATWEDVHPYPHGEEMLSAASTLVNTFQAILVTNGIKSYAVFTYRCRDINWIGGATVGYNAGGEHYENAPESDTFHLLQLGCASNQNTENLLHDLVGDTLPNGTTPTPTHTISSCAAAGHTQCCTASSCLGRGPVRDCYCDWICHQAFDCCYDIADICSMEEPVGNDTYLLFANYFHINRVFLDGSGFKILVPTTSGGTQGLDFHYQRDRMYWGDANDDTINTARLNGSDVKTLINTGVEYVEDLAVDWINDKLYWTDGFYARIEVLDLESLQQRVLVNIGAQSQPRAIVVDPTTGWMYWTDWGSIAKIERASMDGETRMALHTTNIVWPNGVTVDYPEQRLYWSDAYLDRIEYSNVDGSGRRILESESSGLEHPFALTLENDVIVWTEWQNRSIFSTHKLLGSSIIETVFERLVYPPNVIEAITPDRQPEVDNPCDGHDCSHMCLLTSGGSRGYRCACPEGQGLTDNGTHCVDLPRPQPVRGSCIDAGYTGCCDRNTTLSFCAGYPPNCFCDIQCRVFRDCCSDFADICDGTGPPSSLPVPGPLVDISLTPQSANVLTISWRPPEMVHGKIVAYEVSLQTMLSREEELRITVSGGNLAVTATGLEPLVPYYISIRASNIAGYGEVGETVGFTEEGAPLFSPRNVVAMRLDGAHINVSWKPLTLEEARGFIQFYTVTYEAEDSRRREVGSIEVEPNKNSVVIDGLSIESSYLVFVSASTSVGMGPSSPASSSTSGSLFQLHLLGVENCENWLADRQQKISSIISAVANNTNELCNCDLMENQIVAATLHCYEDPNAVTFRAILFGSVDASSVMILDSMREALNGTTLLVRGTLLTVDPECNITIQTFDDPSCDVVQAAGHRADNNNAVIAGSVVVLLLLVAAVLGGFAVLFFLLHRKHKTSESTQSTYNMFNNTTEMTSISNGTESQGAKIAAIAEDFQVVGADIASQSLKPKENEYETVGSRTHPRPENIYQMDPLAAKD